MRSVFSMRAFVASFAFVAVLPLAALDLPPSAWRWFQGDETGWSSPGFDDSAWQTADKPVKTTTLGAVFWLRTVVDAPVDGLERHWFLCGTDGPAFDLYVNGAYVGSRDSVAPYSLQNARPASFVLPRPLGGKYAIALRCAYRGGVVPLPAFSIGSAAEEKVISGSRTFLNARIYEMFTVLNFFLAFYFLAKRLFQGKSEKSSLLFAAILFFFAVAFDQIGNPEPLTDAAWFRGLGRSGIVMGCALLPAFMISFFGLPERKLVTRGSILLGAACTAFVILTAYDENLLTTSVSISMLPTMVFIVYGLVVSLGAALKGRADAWPVAVGIALGLGFGIHDVFFLVTGLTPFAWLQGIAFFAMSIGVFIALSMRQARLEKDLSTYARELEAKRTELGSSVERLVAAGELAAALAVDLDAAAARASEAAEGNAASSSRIVERAEGQASAAREADELVASLVGTIERVNASLGAQSKSVSQTAAAVDELGAEARSIAENIDQSAAFTESLAALTASGDVAAEAMAKTMARVTESSKGIEEILDTLNDFAERTSLLSMNAAIEAAHSGAAGRGFAIIANEVKKLAQSQSERAGRIRDSVSEIVVRVGEGAQAAERLRSTLRDIDSGAAQAVGRIGELRVGTKEQARASAEIGTAMETLAKVGTSIAEEASRQSEIASRVRAAVAGISREASEVREAARTIAADASSLLEEVKLLGELAAASRSANAEPVESPVAESAEA